MSKEEGAPDEELKGLPAANVESEPEIGPRRINASGSRE
jgi:hypothetical protein